MATITSFARVAVLAPCLNEEAAIAKVVRDFQAALPGAAIHVFDNGSTDDTVAVAEAAGAIVHREPQRGKGNVVRRMFADVDADIYVLVDGDDTYDAAAAPEMIALVRREKLDMVTGLRRHEAAAAYRPGHQFGNRLLTGTAAFVFAIGLGDMLSGYRVMSRRFVKSFPALSTGFEIETELSIHAGELRLPTGEVPTVYRERPPGSASKLRTLRDGWRILCTIVKLVQAERPLWFYGLLAALLALVSIGLGLPIVVDFLETGLVPRLPTAVLSMGLMLSALLAGAVGLVLQMVKLARQETKRLAYLTLPPP